MHELEFGVRGPRPTGRTAISRLLFVADAVVADVDELPRAVSGAAAGAHVLTAALPGRVARLVDVVDRFRHVADERLDTVPAQLRREVRGALLDR
jgi:hypothetical protein